MTFHPFRYLALLALVPPSAIDGAATSTNAKCRIEVTPAQASAGACGFDVSTRAFAGTPAEQARCLLRHVGEGAAIGTSDLTPPLAALVGTRTWINLDRFTRYLERRSISPERELGGALRPGLAAVYFVIHDTSSPNCSVAGARGCAAWAELPPDRDEASWPVNRDFGGYAADPALLKAHVVTNRVGGSLTAHEFAEHVSHVRFDFCFDAEAKRNLFVGVENIQARVGRPARPSSSEPINDLIAPDPGFTPAQYRRLALIYIAASARHGRWLIPAYHAVLDRLYDPPTAHDDPQHFDLAAFSADVVALTAAIRHARPDDHRADR